LSESSGDKVGATGIDIRWAIAAVGVVIVVAVLTVVAMRRGGNPEERVVANGDAAATPQAPPKETERDEAVRFVRVLKAGQGDLASLNSREAELIPPISKMAKEIEFWGLMGNGGRYAGQARSAASDADRMRQGYAKARTTLESVPLAFAYSQTKRSVLVAELKAREAFLAELKSRLSVAANDLAKFRSPLSYPLSVKSLSEHAGKWRASSNKTADLIQSFRLDHGITDKEMGQ
jgi:hypothetical protein